MKKKQTTDEDLLFYYVPRTKLLLVRENEYEYTISSSSDIYSFVKEYLIKELASNPNEVFVVVGMNTSNKINVVFRQEGSLNESRVYIAKIAKELLLTNSAQCILVHNHPSGNLKPSDSDIQITTKIMEALRYFEINVLDHLIVNETDFNSFKEMGYL